MKYRRWLSETEYKDKVSQHAERIRSMESYVGSYDVDDYENPFAIEQLINDVDAVDNVLGLYKGQTFKTSKGLKGTVLKWDREYIYVNINGRKSKGKLELIGKSIFLDV